MIRLDLRRIGAVVLGHWYTLRHSPIRVMELVYWPLLEVVLWGFLTNYLRRQDAQLIGGVGVLVGAIVLWDLCFRTQQELAMTQLLAMWDRSLVNLYASPLRLSEEIVGAMAFSLLRVIAGSTMLVAFARVGFGFDIFTTGAVLVPGCIILLVFGWSLGLVVRAGVLRFGSNAEVLAWSLSSLLQPVAAVFYPVSALPAWLRPVSQAIPASHVFEAVRAFLADGTVRAGTLVVGAVLAVVYLVGSTLLVRGSYRAVRVRGLLSRPGY